MTLSTTHPGKLIAPCADAQVIGAGLLALEQSITRSDYAGLLSKYGFDHINPDRWYPLQMLLDMYGEMMRTPQAMQNLVSIGMKVVNVMPPTVTNVVEALQNLDMISAQMITGYDTKTYGFCIEVVEEGHVRVTERTPFPHDLIYGYMYAIAHRYCHPDAYPLVERVYLSRERPNSDGAVYVITW